MTDGNGAREQLAEYFDNHFVDDFDPHGTADHLLLWLAEKGYVIVPLAEETEQ